ncbi:hypothetical protein BH23CHL5_BH23CHL5_06640 [soil metagenome]
MSDHARHPAPFESGILVETDIGTGKDQLVSQTFGQSFEEKDGFAQDALPALVEALLLAAPGPVTIAEISAASECAILDIEHAIATLERGDNRGWVVQRHGNQLQLATDPRFAEPIRRLLGFERESKLSVAALETLAIVAYEQPVTRSSIETVRGVDSSAVLNTLLNRGLIEAEQRLDRLGQPFEYQTTGLFLQHFGIRSLADLPPLAGQEGVNLVEVLAETIAESERSIPELEMVGVSVGDASVGELANA